MMNRSLAGDSVLQNAPLKIYPLGDSITQGIDKSGYRTFLYQMLIGQNISFHFVGTMSDGPAWLPEKNHDGHPGWVIDQILANIDVWLEQTKPDLILLMIGSNDIEMNVQIEEMPARFQNLLEQIALKAPNARVLVSEVSLIRDPAFDELARKFNPKIKSMVTLMAAQGHNFSFVPMHDVLSLDEIDSLDHPNDIGNEKMARRWMDYITEGSSR